MRHGASSDASERRWGRRGGGRACAHSGTKSKPKSASAPAGAGAAGSTVPPGDWPRRALLWLPTTGVRPPPLFLLRAARSAIAAAAAAVAAAGAAAGATAAIAERADCRAGMGNSRSRPHCQQRTPRERRRAAGLRLCKDCWTLQVTPGTRTLKQKPQLR